MENIERRVRREVRAMTREAITKVLACQLTWLQAAQVLAIALRHPRRIQRGVSALGNLVGDESRRLMTAPQTDQAGDRGTDD